jgi:hypothetical protein
LLGKRFARSRGDDRDMPARESSQPASACRSPPRQPRSVSM